MERPADTGLPPRAWRAVTQPEQLLYPYSASSTSLTQAVDVYAYDANPAEVVYDTPTSEVEDTITLFIPGADTNNLYAIYRTQGNSQTPYYRFVAGAGGTPFNVYYAGGTTVVTDALSATPTGAPFYADVYTPPNRNIGPGLRIQLFGTTPTARPYVGPEQSALPSP